MLVYILTEEPYHDNSTILGIFRSQKEGLEALNASVNPEEINGEDIRLYEWDLNKNKCLRRWDMVGDQITDPSREGWYPLRREYTIHLKLQEQ